MEKGTHHHRRYNPRHLTLKLLGRNPPRPFRLLHGSFLPELAHRGEIESGPMTLNRIIFWRLLTSAAGTLPRTG